MDEREMSLLCDRAREEIWSFIPYRESIDDVPGAKIVQSVEDHVDPFEQPVNVSVGNCINDRFDSG